MYPTVPTRSPRKSRPHGQRRTRRGMAAVLAMLFLVLVSILAISFVASVQTSVQVSSNEANGVRCMLGAESGMNFVRKQLYDLNISHSTDINDLFMEVYSTLSAKLNNTTNLGAHSVGISAGHDVISIPDAADAYIPVDGEGTSFRVTIIKQGKELKVQSVGRYDPDPNHATAAVTAPARTIQLRYGIFERPSTIFDYGVASKSNISMIGNTAIIGSPNQAAGSVLSTSSSDFPLSMGSTSSISGEVSFTNPNAWVDAKSGSVINNEKGESNWKDNVHIVDNPDFPEVDTSDYLKYATNVIGTGTHANANLSNIRLKSGSHSFTGNSVLKGVIYVEAPAQISFSGNVTVTGIIVVQNNPSGNWTTNVIDFGGTVNAAGPNAKDASGNYLLNPGKTTLSGTPYEGLENLTGAFILAPKFNVRFGGNSGTSQMSGSIIASALDFYGSVATSIDGSVINLDESYVKFQGKASVTIKSKGTHDKPSGLFFGSRYEPLPGSYTEIIQ